MFVQDLYNSFVGKISVRDLLARSEQISMQRLCTKSLSEASMARSRRASSPHKTSLPRSLHKISAGSKISPAPQRLQPDTPKVPRGLRERSQHEQHPQRERFEKPRNDERVARTIAKFAPRHNERERSERPKVTRGLRPRKIISCEASVKNEKMKERLCCNDDQICRSRFPMLRPSKTEAEGFFVL